MWRKILRHSHFVFAFGTGLKNAVSLVPALEAGRSELKNKLLMTSKDGPIILIDDDEDEYDLMREILATQKLPNELICFGECQDALHYLRTTNQKPFIIFCDLNMPVMNGLELRRIINTDQRLREKSIPFIFLTTTASPIVVKEAYDMSVQGFFEKGTDIVAIGKLIREIFDYWQRCIHPNDFR